MKRSIVRACGMAVVLAPLAAHAQIYICKDASGRTISSDRPLPECSGSKTREMSREGFIKREIPPEPTLEQRRQKQIDDERRLAEQKEAERKRQFDRTLVARYPTEGHIEVIRRRTLAALQEKISVSAATIKGAERLQADLEADRKQKRQKALSADAQGKWDNADRTIKSERENIEAYEAEKVSANAKFDDALQRYREINGLGPETGAGAPAR